MAPGTRDAGNYWLFTWTGAPSPPAPLSDGQASGRQEAAPLGPPRKRGPPTLTTVLLTALVDPPGTEAAGPVDDGAASLLDAALHPPAGPKGIAVRPVDLKATPGNDRRPPKVRACARFRRPVRLTV